jgi:hypothetical protein
MKRRDVIAGVLIAATMGRAQAQQTGKVYRIAIVHPSTPVTDLNEASGPPSIRAIFEELRFGWAMPRDTIFWSSDTPARGGPRIIQTWRAR